MDKAIIDKYEPVIGLEVHIQLLTKSKAYSSDSTEFGALPNSQVSPITLGHPGTLPMVNKEVVEFAIRLGIACKCNITPINEYARKNYFYADLPKGYQITQHLTPICTGGYITINSMSDNKKPITLTRIHMEEDTGKSMHDQDPYDTLIDLNRAGVPLLEIVTEPVVKNSDEAYQYLTELRRLVRYLGICDGNMEEGSLRCDANVSVRKKGVEKFGTKIEVKNMNSIRNVQSAIEHEIIRQIEVLENGGTLTQETRSFDATKGTTFSMRTKESADDYRYFPEPDLLPILVTEKDIQRVKGTLPPLPEELFEKYTKKYSLSNYDASVLIDNKEFALYFEELTGKTSNYKAAANWMMGDVKSYINENALHISQFPLQPAKVAEIIALIESGKVSYTIASQQIFPELIKTPAKTAQQIAEENNLIQESDSNVLEQFVAEAISKYPEKVIEYKNGKAGLLGLFMGEVMKLSKGKADPKKASQMVKEALDKN
ncbi:MAG TPA: Asp-tRNA(Asn)/Glu-tRNA(Gln) amidotransferase subunit GatB [Bacteroidia bacterium]|nr:Asp-tRNA(Asn)/Glu-tRNA(Gln) amidotransferase subunit GatB [Bacteroidia bacterium]